MRSFSISPVEMVASGWRHRDLVLALVKRDVVGRYRGSFMGIFWSFFHPVFMLAVYTFVFGIVFRARWTTEGHSNAEFALVLFTGLIVFNLFSECVNRAPSLIVSNVSYVKKVVFPLEVLPLVAIGSALFHTFVSFIVWLAFFVVLSGAPHGTVLLLPLVLFPVALFALGVSWGLASLGVYLRDVTQVVGILTTALLFLSPIFYPISALPEEFRHLLALNPLTHSIELTRDALLWGKLPNWLVLAMQGASSLVVAWFGFAWFQKTRRGFADVL